MYITIFTTARISNPTIYVLCSWGNDTQLLKMEKLVNYIISTQAV